VKFSSAILRGIAAFLAVSVIQVIAGTISPVLLPKTLPEDMARHFLFWMLLANAITVTALSVFALRSEWRGWKLGAVVAAIPVAITFINGIEGAIFLKNSHIDWPRIFLMTAIAAILSVPVWTLLFGRRKDVPPEHFHPIVSKSRGERAWKFLLCDASYLLLYLVAGTIIWPYIRDFYATQTVPSMGTISALQLLVRGPAFVALCLLLVRMLGMPRVSGAFAVGILFTLMSGLAPLLIPNPYFPDSVRWMHLCEVTSSNFIFAVLVGWLWGKSSDAIHAPAIAQAA